MTRYLVGVLLMLAVLTAACRSPERSSPAAGRSPESETADARHGRPSSETYERMKRRVVKIESSASSLGLVGVGVPAKSQLGAGVAIKTDGLILTASHVTVVAFATAKDGITLSVPVHSVSVTTYAGEKLEGTVVWRDALRDLALVKVQAMLEPARIRKAPLQDGDPVVIIGHPLELDWSVALGWVMRAERILPKEVFPHLQIGSVVLGGNSGGPVFDREGNLVGITRAIKLRQESQGIVPSGIAFAVPIRTFCEVQNCPPEILIPKNGKIPAPRGY